MAVRNEISVLSPDSQIPPDSVLASRRARGTDSRDPLYSARGNGTTIPQPGDLDDDYTCVYDAWNPPSPRLRRPGRLVKGAEGETTIAKYEYDGLNRRTKSHIDSEARCHAFFSGSATDADSAGGEVAHRLA